MKRWHRVLVPALCALSWLSLPAGARAETFEDLPPVLAQVLARLAVIFDNLLASFVSGNVLTDPKGEGLVGVTAQIVMNVTQFLAELVKLF